MEKLPSKAIIPNKLYDIEEDWNLIIAAIKETYGDIDIWNMRARDFMNVYLPYISSKTAFGRILQIMNTDDKDLSENEKKIKRNRTKILNKDKNVRSANDFNKFARMAFSRKEDKK